MAKQDSSWPERFYEMARRKDWDQIQEAAQKGSKKVRSQMEAYSLYLAVMNEDFEAARRLLDAGYDRTTIVAFHDAETEKPAYSWDEEVDGNAHWLTLCIIRKNTEFPRLFTEDTSQYKPRFINELFELFEPSVFAWAETDFPSFSEKPAEERYTNPALKVFLSRLSKQWVYEHVKKLYFDEDILSRAPYFVEAGIDPNRRFHLLKPGNKAEEVAFRPGWLLLQECARNPNAAHVCIPLIKRGALVDYPDLDGTFLHLCAANLLNDELKYIHETLIGDDGVYIYVDAPDARGNTPLGRVGEMALQSAEFLGDDDDFFDEDEEESEELAEELSEKVKETVRLLVAVGCSPKGSKASLLPPVAAQFEQLKMSPPSHLEFHTTIIEELLEKGADLKTNISRHPEHPFTVKDLAFHVDDWVKEWTHYSPRVHGGVIKKLIKKLE